MEEEKGKKESSVKYNTYCGARACPYIPVLSITVQHLQIQSLRLMSLPQRGMSQVTDCVRLRAMDHCPGTFPHLVRNHCCDNKVYNQSRCS